MTTFDEHADQLRRWAKGMYPEEAAVELLIRAFHGQYADPGYPWIVRDDERSDSQDWYWVDWSEIPDNIGALSGGERRFLMFTASIAARLEVYIGDIITGNDRFTTELFLAAISHGAGTHQGSRLVLDQDGLPTGYEKITTPLYPWPDAG